MLPKIYIDGQSGTTGLQIRERLAGRSDIEQLIIPEELRRDPNARKEYLNSADIVFLCLPDAAAVEAVALIDNPSVRVIDASTAHRTAPGWDYGFPELSAKHREAVKNSKRLANPGCHASGAISSIYPLVAAGILPRDYPLACFSLTGYTGGGKSMIAEYEAEGRPSALDSPRIYGTAQSHKHLPEISAVSGLTVDPVFCPIVADFPQGMATTICLHSALLNGKPSPADIREALAAHYAGCRFVSVAPLESGNVFIESNRFAGTNSLQLMVSGNAERITVTALFDNLGKGASGAAVQNMNIMLDLPEDSYLK